MLSTGLVRFVQETQYGGNRARPDSCAASAFAVYKRIRDKRFRGTLPLSACGGVRPYRVTSGGQGRRMEARLQNGRPCLSRCGAYAVRRGQHGQKRDMEKRLDALVRYGQEGAGRSHAARLVRDRPLLDGAPGRGDSGT